MQWFYKRVWYNVIFCQVYILYNDKMRRFAYLLFQILTTSQSENYNILLFTIVTRLCRRMSIDIIFLSGHDINLPSKYLCLYP